MSAITFLPLDVDALVAGSITARESVLRVCTAVHYIRSLLVVEGQVQHVFAI